MHQNKICIIMFHIYTNNIFPLQKKKSGQHTVYILFVIINDNI